MNIQVHIERLVLDGLPAGVHDGASIQLAVQVELARLLSQPAAPLPFRSSSTRSCVRAGSIRLHRDSQPSDTAAQIAVAIHSALETSASAPTNPIRSSPRPQNQAGAPEAGLAGRRGSLR